MSAVRVGIIGFGSIGQIHARALARCPSARLVAVAGRSAERARQVLADEAVAVHADYRDLLARPDVDLVSICTPSGLHAAQALDAIAVGKHVVVEKPLALDLEAGERVVRAARERGVLLSVISQRRFEPQNRYLKQVIASGALGRPLLAEALVRWFRDRSYYAQADWRGTTALDGGALMNQAIHVVDLLSWYMGPAARVCGATATLVHDIEAEDTAVAALRFESGALGLIAAATSTPPGLPAELNLFFERGTVAVHDAAVTRWEAPGISPPPPPEATPGSGSSDPSAIGILGHVRQWQDILAALAEGRDPFVCGEDGLASLRLVLAIYGSSASKQALSAVS